MPETRTGWNATNAERDGENETQGRGVHRCAGGAGSFLAAEPSYEPALFRRSHFGQLDEGALACVAQKGMLPAGAMAAAALRRTGLEAILSTLSTGSGEP